MATSTRISLTQTDDSTVGTVAWANPSNAAASDGSKSSATGGAGATTHYHKSLNFVHSSGTVLAAGDTINNIKYRYERSESGSGNVRDDKVYPVIAGSIDTVTNYADTGLDWPSTDTVKEYTQTTNLPSAAQIISSDFGVVLSAKNQNGFGYVGDIDYVEVIVDFTPSSTPATVRKPVVIKTGQFEQLQSPDHLEGVWYFRGNWSSDAAYVPGEIVNLSGIQYVCILAHSNNTPPNAIYWTPLSVTSHAGLPGLSADDHTQYALLAGRGSLQTLYGSVNAGGVLNLIGTSHATKGIVSLASDLMFLNQATGIISVYGSGIERLRITDAGSITAYDASSVLQFSVIGQALFIGATVEVGIDPASSGTGSIVTMWTGTTPPSAGTDRVKLYAADFAAGSTRLYVQSETGVPIILGGSAIICPALNGSVAANGNLTLRSTTDTTKGAIFMDTFGYWNSGGQIMYRPGTVSSAINMDASSLGGACYMFDSVGNAQYAEYASGTQTVFEVHIGGQTTGDGALIIGGGYLTQLTTGSGYIAYKQARVQPVAQADYVSHYAKDKTAAHSCLYVQGESGNPIIIGDAQVETDNFKSNVATGTQPYICASTTQNDNLNAELWQGLTPDFVAPDINGFRLTLVTNDPIPTANQTAKTTLYWTPYKHNKIGLYTGSEWVIRSTAEISIAVGTLINEMSYDVFVYDNAGAPTLELLEWANDTVTMTIASPCVVTWTGNAFSNGDRIVFSTSGALPTGITAGTCYYIQNRSGSTFNIASTPAGANINTSGTQSGTHTGHNSQVRQTGLDRQDGALIKSGDATRLYVGSILTKTTTTLEDSLTYRSVWNYFNRVTKRLNIPGSVQNNHTYGTNTWRRYNNSDTDNLAEAFIGLGGEVDVQCNGNVVGNGGASTGNSQIGVTCFRDAANFTPAPQGDSIGQSATNSNWGTTNQYLLGQGRVYMRLNERTSAGTGTFSFAYVDGFYAG